MSESIENILRHFVEREVRIIERLRAIASALHLKYAELRRIIDTEKIEKDVVFNVLIRLLNTIDDLDYLLWELKDKKELYPSDPTTDYNSGLGESLLGFFNAVEFLANTIDVDKTSVGEIKDKLRMLINNHLERVKRMET